MELKKILLVDDELTFSAFLEQLLQRKAYEVTCSSTAKEALFLLKKENYDLLITDMRLPDLSGMELLRKARESAPHMAIILMTAYGTIETAVEAMRLGAYTYLIKPFTPDALELLLEKLKEKASNEKRFSQEGLSFREESGSRRLQTQLIAQSPVMKKILDEMVRVAKSQAHVFIEGESGTGKEVLAAAIHTHSWRARSPYIRVNCAAIPETLMESEFFGHEKGAFTGAHSRRLGRFELADKGTLLLDEVTEISPHLQSKLLRVIQEQVFERVGGCKSLSVDVRLIATSNRDVKKAVQEKSFREDLYYRLSVVPIHLPPLRERPEDILPLTQTFLHQLCLENQKPVKTLSKAAEKALINYPWPGNIRELANVLERTVVLDYGPQIEPEHLFLPC